ncbi:ribosome small subunit-dependent GTPase A [Stomatobaculum longum]|uniref:Small ribosomal subunit biogenesis GTPase RsgA n=1 Tax=Stomatobaculum longum TaxID=796942 RepID=A0AA37DGY9_9FIRM|nr:ribosome small subunit-dependent GTPase A [Stomatobaculum longum]EHO17970.1 ribosome small subunit-dependent GTPase A [Stomatobaculum longum]
MRGKIIKGIAGFYLVDCGGEVLTCKARGLFRKRGEKPLVGDLAEVEAAQTSESEANIVTLLPRKNRLIRPAVSNVDQALVVMAVRTPDPQFYLLDQYLVTMELQEIPAAILFTKEDLDRGELADYRSRYETAGYPVFSVSAENGSGLEALRAYLAGKTTVLAGPSGVGKSTLTNLLCPAANMETGELSRKNLRGKQTTRHTELFCLGENSYLLDTPGFTAVEVWGDTEAFKQAFPEIRALEGQCRFTGCNHGAEPDCAVKAAVARGEIAASRYESYRKMAEESAERRKY